MLSLITALLLSQGIESFNAPAIYDPNTVRSSVALSLPFSTPGCYPSGTGGVSITRATTATYESAPGVISSCAAGSYRVEANGLLVEGARSNYTINSEDLTAASYTTTGTCAITANQGPAGWTDLDLVNCTGSVNDNRGETTGNPTASTIGPVTTCWWVAAQTGTTTATVTHFANSQNMSSVSCIRSDGGVCNVAGSGTIVAYTYATIGTTPVRLCLTSSVAVAQTLWQSSVFNGQRTVSIGGAILAGRVQKEIGAYPTSYIPTSGALAARNADQVSATAPFLPSGNWTVVVDARPYLDRAWSQAGRQTMVALGTTSAANTMTLWQDAGSVYGSAYDNTATFSYVSAVSPGFIGPRRVATTDTGGQLGLWRDGVLLDDTESGTGTGLWTASPTPIYVGNDSSIARAWDGWIKNLKLCRSSVLARCK